MRRRRKKKIKPYEMLELNMTAMADVIFNLLIYLLLTAKPIDVFTNLDVNRPAPDKEATPDQHITDMVTIKVFSDGFTVNDKAVRTAATLESVLKQLAEMSKTQTILIQCAWDSPHERLVQVLDLCGVAGLNNLSVMSM